MPSSKPDAIESTKARGNRNTPNSQEDNEESRLHVCTEATDWAKRGVTVCLHTEEATEADRRRDAIERLKESRTGGKSRRTCGGREKVEDHHEKKEPAICSLDRLKQVSSGWFSATAHPTQLSKRGLAPTHPPAHKFKVQSALCLVFGLRSTHTSVHHGRQRPSLR